MNICVFASSSNDLDEIYYKNAQLLGQAIAKAGHNIVYGGSNLGLMGAVTRAAKDKGAEVTGIMPQKLYNLGIKEGNCSEFILTKGMRERKAKMDELSQALIALPGGFGTLEEFSEMLVQKQLGYCDKPMILYNCRRYYDDLIRFFDNIIKQKFAPNNTNMLYYITDNPDEAINYINSYEAKFKDYLGEKLKLKN